MGWQELKHDRDDPERQKLRQQRMLDLEDEVYQTAAGVLKANLDFYQVEPTQVDPPEEWVREYGPVAAKQRLAVARAGWMPESLAPSAVKRAERVIVGIGRARRAAAQQLGPAEINVKLHLPAPTSAEQPGAPVYPVLEVE